MGFKTILKVLLPIAPHGAEDFFGSCMGFRRPEVQVFSPRCLKALGANASKAFSMSAKTDISVSFSMFWKVRGVQNGVQGFSHRPLFCPPEIILYIFLFFLLTLYKLYDKIQTFPDGTQKETEDMSHEKDHQR